MPQKKKLLIVCFSIFVCGLLAFWYVNRVALKQISDTKTLCKNCNILLISLDTCGASHMSTYGYTRDTTPNLSLLAKEGVFFENAYANGTWSLPTHVSMFTGVYTYIHNVTQSYDSTLSKKLPLITEILQHNGYDTYFYAPKDEAIFPGERVYTRGVFYWDSEYWNYRGKEGEYLNLAINKIAENNKNNKKAFVFFHTNMCHSPYFTEEEPLLYTESKFPSLPLQMNEVFNTPFTYEYYQYLLRRLPQGLKDGDFRRNPEKIQMLLAALQNAPDFTAAKRAYDEAEENLYWGEVSMDDYKEKFNYWNKIDIHNSELVEYLKALYDQKLHKVDTELISLLRERLHNESWKNNTIVIVTSGHGEEFMEHGAIGHATLYDFNTKIPLLFLIPGMSPKSVKNNVQQVDLAPTLLDAIGISGRNTFNGKSLIGVLRGKTLEERLLIAGGDIFYHPDLTTVRDGVWKLFVSEKENSILPYALYNTEDDPGEKNDILKGNMERAEVMVHRYLEEKKRSENLFDQNK